MNPRNTAPGIYRRETPKTKANTVTKLHPDLSVKEVAELTKQSPDVVAQLVRQGYFPNAYKAGTGSKTSPVRIPYADVEAYRTSQPRAAG